MSYNRMQDSQDISQLGKPLHNGERYPPIALPAPPPHTDAKSSVNSAEPGSETLNYAPQLESGLIVIMNTSGAGLEENSFETKNLIFNDQSIRKGFIRKVYFILLTQLLFTLGVMCLFMYHEPTKLFVQQNQSVLAVAMILNMVIVLSMACCESARRTYPTNFVLLGLFTFTMSLLLGAVASTLDANAVLIAVGITAVLVISLSIFAIQTKYDFTAWGGVMIAVVVCLIVLAFAGAFFREVFDSTALSCVGALLASFLLIYDTQLIIGGTHKYQFSPEEYVFAALTLYIDVVRILLYILRMMRR